MKSSVLVFLAVALPAIRVTAQDCAGQVDCSACRVLDSGCAWCQASLQKTGTADQTDLGVGACVLAADCSGQGTIDLFAGVGSLAGQLSDALTTELVLAPYKDSGDACPPGIVSYSVAAAGQTDCAGCQAVDAKKWCSMAILPFTGGMCVADDFTSCAGSTWDLTSIDSSLAMAARLEEAECPTCGTQNNCETCSLTGGCTWCVPKAIVTNKSSGGVTKQVLDVGVCAVEADGCPTTLGTLPDLVKGLPTSPLTASVTNRKVSVPSNCLATASGSAWSTVADCAACIKTEGNSWCTLSGTVNYDAEQSFDTSGGACLTSVDVDKCVDLTLAVPGFADFGASFTATASTDCGSAGSAAFGVSPVCAVGAVALGAVMLH